MFENKLAIASVSLGQHESHSLPRKIIAAGRQGFSGIEVTYFDLEAYSRSKSMSMLRAAEQIRDLCQQQNLTILSFCAFENFEGHKSPITERLETAKTWLGLAHALGAIHLQIPAIYLRDINNSHSLMISELQQLADLARQFSPVIKIAYENLAWSTECVLWQDALRTVRDVDRPNFGLCLDSFHIAAALWGDMHASSGVQTNGEQTLKASLQDFVRDCPVDKIFYIQLSDGERIDPPYSKDHPWFDPTLEPGHVWSNEARPFPIEAQYGAYMPVRQITQAFLVDAGFQGWVSLETFDRRMRTKEQNPEKNAKRAMDAWGNLKTKLSEDNT